MNIVTIDFDIIMAPSINLYNDYIGDEDVDDVIENYPFLINMPADFGKYEYLTRYIINCAKNNVKIYFISNHGSVVPITRKAVKELANEDKHEKVNLYNIDHHHDIYYGDDKNYKQKLIGYDCGNWVKYLKDNFLIDYYTWIKNENSVLYLPDGAEEIYLQEKIDLKNFSLNKFEEKTDILIICGSFEWIPLQYHILYTIWQSIYEEITEKEYNIDSYKKEKQNGE